MTDQFKPIGMIMGQTLHSLMRLVRVRLSDMEGEKLTVDQLGLLFAISQHEDDLIQKDLAEKMGKDKSAILRMIDLLQEKGLIIRVVKDNDRRKNQLELTEKGNETIKLLIIFEKQVKKQVLDGLTEEEITTFYKVLAHIRKKGEQF